jgi:hypothetical protein
MMKKELVLLICQAQSMAAIYTPPSLDGRSISCGKTLARHVVDLPRQGMLPASTTQDDADKRKRATGAPASRTGSQHINHQPLEYLQRANSSR